MLDVDLSLYYGGGKNENGSHSDVFEINPSVGLSKTFVSMLTFSGSVGLAYATRVVEPFQYHYQLSNKTTYNVWGITTMAQVAVHLPSELVGLTGGVTARTFFIPTRSGIFRIDAFAGIVLKIKSDGVLKGVRIKAAYLFPLVDDFTKVFEINTDTPSFAIACSWQF